MKVKIKPINNGLLPMYSRIGDACMDCYANESINIAPKSRALVHLGFALELPAGYEAIIRPRSGLSKKGVDISIGTVDSNYRGEVMVNVVNTTGSYYPVITGDRICQIAIRRTEDIEWNIQLELSDSNRGSNGFGSSGR